MHIMLPNTNECTNKTMGKIRGGKPPKCDTKHTHIYMEREREREKSSPTAVKN